MYGYSDKPLMSPDILMTIAADYYTQFDYDPLISFTDDDHHHHRLIPVFESEELGFQASESESAYISVHREVEEGSDEMIKAKIAAHPSYPKLLDAYIDCQKVGAPPEIAVLFDEIRPKKDACKQDDVSMCFGVDPELDEFMETYCDILVKCKTDLSRPFDEATSFLNNIQTQLGNLCKGQHFRKFFHPSLLQPLRLRNQAPPNRKGPHDGVLMSDDEFSGGETEMHDLRTITEDRELKDRLLRRYGNHINSLKLEFSMMKKKKKGKLPKEAKQTLLEWWNVHYKWPYPMEADKISLAEMTGLDQKQINNWFINQRKRHWKPSVNMHLAKMDNLFGHSFMEG
ncbi:hypothetical protein DH2020_049734 [Rehmannia glutinosa]|uniref:Homeobox protein knotted-1-like 6 n=1 Tax=Rehmannia glutinosa TaxID=99300 RepID=A0ABR0U208_REHGL